MTFLMKCIPVMETFLREKGYMTYFDYMYYLRNMLREDAEKSGRLIQYISRTHRYFLVDEFQDTNPMQAEIFFYLASDNPVGDWKSCVPRPGALFIVGDPKQSIYRFRNADVRSYLSVKKIFGSMADSEILYLTRNFRSRKAMCEYFNQIFEQTLQESDSQSGYTQIPIAEDKMSEFEGVYTYTSYAGKSKQENPEYAEEVQLGKVIQTLVDNENYLITTDGDKQPRKITYKDIMVIVYNKNALSKLLPTFDKLNIPVRIEGKVLFEENEALEQIYRLYRFATKPDDKVNIYAALTSKIVGLSSEELLAYMEEGGELSLDEKANSNQEKSKLYCNVEHQLENLKHFSLIAKNLSPAALYYKILEEFKVYCYVDVDKMEIVYYTLELLRNEEKSGQIISLDDGEKYLDTLIHGKSDLERCLSLKDNTNCVHFANLHKVKGLEAPIVILAFAWDYYVGADNSIVYEDTGVEGYYFRLRGDKMLPSFGKEVLFGTTQYMEKELAENKIIKDEEARLVYVAATRARNALIISDSMYIKYNGDEVHNSKWGSLIDKTEQDFFRYDSLHGNKSASLTNSAPPKAEKNVRALYEQAEQGCVLKQRDTQAPSYSIQTPSHIKLASKLDDETEFVFGDTKSGYEESDGLAVEQGTPKEKSPLHTCPNLLGTTVHRLMEMMVASRNKLDVDAAIKEIVDEYVTLEYERYTDALIVALKEIAAKMRAGGYPQKNQTQQDILQMLLQADEVCTEVPFCYAEEQDGETVVYNGIMDVVYCEGGDWHIIDYKTNYDDSNLDEHYKPQLDAYKKAFRKITGHDADAKIYHIEVL